MGGAGPLRRFVGRVEELRRLDAALAAARDGRGMTVFLAGEPGIGKSSLATEFADRAGRFGGTVLVGRCIPRIGAALPYLPFIDALRTLPGPPVLAGEANGSQLQLFETVLARLDGLGAAPLVLVLEDLHWADGSTLDLLTFLAYACTERRLLIVATLRRDAGETAVLVEQLVPARRAIEVPVEPLGEEELGQLLQATAAKPVPPDLIAEIHARSEGNPFFAEELLIAATRGDARLPAKLREALLLHIAQLKAPARAALRAIAATGRDVPYRLLAAVTRLADDSLTEALRQAAEQGVMRYDQESGTFRIRHALLAEAIYTTLLPGEREQLHLRIAHALTDEPALAVSGRVAAELAHHWAGAGLAEHAFEASVRAARDAEAVYGLGEALQHAERAITLWPSVPVAAELAGSDLPGMLSWAAQLGDLTGDITRAVELIRMALEIAGPEALRRGQLHERAGTYLLHLGRQQEAVAEFRRAVELVPQQPASAVRARVLAALANAVMAPDRYEESIEFCDRALAVAEEVGDDRAALLAMTVRARDLCCLGRTEEGIEQLWQAHHRAQERGTPQEITRVYILLADVLNTACRSHEAIRVANDGLAVARRHGLERGQGIALRVNAADALLSIGDWARAETVLTAALRTVGTFWSQHPHLFQAQLHIGRGEFSEAREHLLAASQAAGKLNAAGHYAYLQAELALWQGRYHDALLTIDNGLGQADGPVPPEHELRLWTLGLRVDVELAQLATANRDTAALQEIQQHADRLVTAARATEMYAADAGAWRAQAEAEYARVGNQPDPDLWRTAVSTWDSLERPYLAAYCRWRLAESLVAASVPAAEAAVPAREAHRVARWLGARPLREELERLSERARLDLVGLVDDPGRAQPDPAHPLGLTEREQEVLELLSRGYTNRDIGAELTISAKTASVHVSNILRKLNARTRVEAATIAHRLLRRR